MMNRLFSRVFDGLTMLPGPAYSSGDQVGDETEIKLTVGIGAIATMMVTDRTKRLGPIDAFIFDAPSHPAADNAAAGWKDDDLVHLVAVVHLTSLVTTERHNIVEAPRPGGGTMPVALIKAAAGTSLYVNMITRSDHLPFVGPQDLTWVIGLEP